MIDKFIIGCYYTLDLESFKCLLESSHTEFLAGEEELFSNNKIVKCLNIKTSTEETIISFNNSKQVFGYTKEMLTFFTRVFKYKQEELEL